MKARRGYPCRLRINQTELFVIWYSDERDGFVRDQGDRLLVTSTSAALAAAAEAHDVALVKDEAAEYDFDRIRAWCLAPSAEGIDCAAFVDAWNFFDDLAGLSDGADTPYTRLSRAGAARYDKLFWGCNLPAVTPAAERFEPDWEAAEVGEIRRLLAAGLDLLASELHATEHFNAS